MEAPAVGSAAEPDRPAPPIRSRATAHRRRDLVSGALLVAFVLKLGVALVVLNRGFEMGDEGYFLLNLNHPEAALPPFEIYRVLGRVTGGAAIGVVSARLFRIAAELAGSLALIGGVFVWARARVFPPGAAGFASFLLLCLQGTLLSVASRSLGYNDMTNLFTYSAVGCLFAIAGLPAGATFARMLLAVAAGALTGGQLAVKFSTALLLAPGLSLVLGLGLRSLPARERLRLLAGYWGGLAATTGGVVAATGGAGAMGDRLAIAARLPGLTGYDPVALLWRYLLADFFTELHLLVFVLSFPAALWAMRRRGASADHARMTALGVAALVLGLGVGLLHPTFLHASLVVLASLLLGLSAVLFAQAYRRMPLLLVLFALPFIAIAGTNVPITMRLPTYALPLFVALAVLLLELRSRGEATRFHGAVVVLLMAVSGFVFAHHHVLHPYGLAQPIYEQRWEARALPGVGVDRATRDFLDEVSAQMSAAGFERGDPVIAFDYMPGLVYALGGTSPRYNLYLFDLPAFNCFNANLADRSRPPFVILGEPMDEAQRGCLEWIRFPDDFRLIRTVRFPYESVYAGFGKPGFSQLYLYAPRERAPR